MQNLILQPSGSKAAMEHFDKTIKKGLKLEEIKGCLNESDILNLSNIFGNNKLEIWGVTPGQKDINVNKWQRTRVGDLVLFSGDNKIFYVAQLAYTLHNKELAEFLWGYDNNGNTWEYLYFLIGGTEDYIQVSDLNDLLGYQENNVIKGFNVIDKDKAQLVIGRYGNFENALSEISSNFSEPQEEDISKIKIKVKNFIKPEDVEKLLKDISEETKNVRAQEKIRVVKAIVRNRKIADLIKKKYNYICQICGDEGFEKKNGGKYAEAHHKDELAISKWDHPDNLICVCANCHRKLHYGK